MRQFISKLRGSLWKYRQPLTRIPNSPGAPVSDLFVWRSSNEWETFVELIDLPSLFEGSASAKGRVTIVFFNKSGTPVLERSFELTAFRRHRIPISTMVSPLYGCMGTFAVFHSHTPETLSSLGCHLAERGYVSYRYRGAPLCSYVHGNLDAVTRLPNGDLHLLGGQSFARRKYNLQMTLAMGSLYEFGVVNSTKTAQTILCRRLSDSGSIIDSEAANIPSGGLHIFKVNPKNSNERISFFSRLIMARPLVFSIKNQLMDVFHG